MRKLKMSIYQVKISIFAFHLFLNGFTFLAALLLTGFQVQQLKSNFTPLIATCRKLKGKKSNNSYHIGQNSWICQGSPLPFLQSCSFSIFRCPESSTIQLAQCRLNQEGCTLVIRICSATKSFMLKVSNMLQGLLKYI